MDLTTNFWQGILTSSIVLVGLLVLLVVIYYITSYVGLKKRRDYMKKFQEQLKPGKNVLFGGGIVGKIVSIGDEYAMIEVTKGNNFKVARYAIQEIVE